MGACNWSAAADTLALPFWLLMIWYFGQKQRPTLVETVLLLFAATALIVDSYFVYSASESGNSTILSCLAS